MARKKKTGQVLVLDTGERFSLTGETGRYYQCEGAQFRKGNPHVRIEEEVIEEAAEAAGDEERSE